MPIGSWLRDGRIAPKSPNTRAAKAFFEKRLQAHQCGKSDERLFLWAQAVLSGAAK